MFGIEIDLLEDDPVVRLRGEVGAHNAAHVCAYATNALDRSRSLRLVLDVEELDFIDAAGVQAFRSILDRVREEGGDTLVLRSPSPATLEVIESNGLDRVFTIERRAS